MLARRGFLGAVLDPERLLWVPGRKLISIPIYDSAQAQLNDITIERDVLL